MALLPRGPNERAARAVLAEIRDRIRRLPRPDARLVVSDERLELSPPDLFARLVHEELTERLPGARIRVINYIRPHAERLLASFAEQCKMGWTRDGIEDFRARWARNGRIDYAPRLAAWRDAFGPAFEPRPYLRDADKSWNVIADFVAAIDPAEVWHLPAPPETAGNISLGLKDLIRLRHLHGRLEETIKGLFPRPLRAHHRLGWELARHFARLPAADPQRLRLDRATARRIAGQWQADAAGLDSDWFQGLAPEGFFAGRLEAAVEQAADKAMDLSPETHFTASELRSLDLWADVMAQAMRTDPSGFLDMIRLPARG